MTTPHPIRGVFAVCLGNALAFYDLLIFSILSIQISHAIFPPGNPTAALIQTLGVFGAGFLTRPLGALIIGRYADKQGRKPALLIAFSLVGIAVIGQALVPPYAAIGVWAPILMLFFRLLLGFGIGGEVGPATAYLAEAAPDHRRGLFVSMQFCTQDAAVFSAGVVGFLLAHFLSDQQLTDWGWRVALLIGALIIPFGLYARAHLHETLRATPSAPMGGAGASLWPIGLIALGLIIMGSSSVANYGNLYISTYGQTVLGIKADLAFLAPIAAGLFGMPANVLSGLAADRFGRRPVMLLGWGVLIVSTPLAYEALQMRPTAAMLLIVAGWLGAWIAFGAVAALTAVTESLPMATRSTSLSLLYALGIALFGGSTQVIISWLVATTGNPLSPAWYITGVLCAGLAAMLGLRESRPLQTVSA
jgi:MFS transporter, MHS family, citrate/tricarballylate:H+ symporter